MQGETLFATRRRLDTIQSKKSGLPDEVDWEGADSDQHFPPHMDVLPCSSAQAFGNGANKKTALLGWRADLDLDGQ
jgi:hypothetical protein